MFYFPPYVLYGKRVVHFEKWTGGGKSTLKLGRGARRRWRWRRKTKTKTKTKKEKETPSYLVVV
jgi:hypothetical protein